MGFQALLLEILALKMGKNFFNRACTPKKSCPNFKPFRASFFANFTNIAVFCDFASLGGTEEGNFFSLPQVFKNGFYIESES